MTSSKRLAAVLSLAALLFGNAAGWWHAGTHLVVDCAAQESRSSQAVVASRSQCSCRHHCQPSESVADSSDGQTDTRRQSQLPPCEHDHESCAICQAFLSIRQAMSSTVAVIADRAALSTELAVVPTTPRLPSKAFSSFAPRGPPAIA